MSASPPWRADCDADKTTRRATSLAAHAFAKSRARRPFDVCVRARVQSVAAAAL
jgi:hypothetical protein